MNCPKDRSRMEYIPEMSEPRYRKLVFYCHNCRAFRITYEPDKEKLFAMLLDGIDFGSILAPKIRQRLSPS
ncbi:MAG: hypothetical protein ACREBS_02310 [Nitrososphaerales archaeon]